MYTCSAFGYLREDCFINKVKKIISHVSRPAEGKRRCGRPVVVTLGVVGYCLTSLAKCLDHTFSQGAFSECESHTTKRWCEEYLLW